MRPSCMCTLLHCTSTDEDPHHELCPEGAESWCFYQKAQALGIQPKPHDEELGENKMRLTEYELSQVKEVYDDLTNDELLRKCLKGRTQNQNESSHGKLWRKVQKTKFYGKDTIETAAQSVILETNFTFTESNIMSHMDFSGESDAREYLDKRRDLAKQEKSGTMKRKRFRKSNNNTDPDYGAGLF